MSQPPEANAPFARTREAVRDIARCGGFHPEARGATQHHADRLVLGHDHDGGVCGGTARKSRAAGAGPARCGSGCGHRHSTAPTGPARANRRAPSRSREFRRPRVDEISPAGKFRHVVGSDPGHGSAKVRGSHRPVVRSPNGVLEDFARFWAAGPPAYEPANIRAPTLLIVGDWDVITPPTMARGLYDASRQRPRTAPGIAVGRHTLPGHRETPRAPAARSAELSRRIVRRIHMLQLRPNCECCNTRSGRRFRCRLDLLLRVHLLRALRRRNLEGQLPQLRRRAGAPSAAGTREAAEVPGLDRTRLQAGRLRKTRCLKPHSSAACLSRSATSRIIASVSILPRAAMCRRT